MPSNKRIRRKPARSTRELVAETAPAPKRAADLRKAVHRLEVEIATAGRLASESRGGSSTRQLGYASQQRLTHAQARQRRARWMMQAAMFLTSTCLLAGAGAWLYRFWLSVR